MNWYTPILFGFGLNLISTICFVVIPIFTVLLLFFSKRKFLWMAPFISTFLMFVICVIAEGPSLLSVGEYRGDVLGNSCSYPNCNNCCIDYNIVYSSICFKEETWQNMKQGRYYRPCFYESTLSLFGRSVIIGLGKIQSYQWFTSSKQEVFI